MLQLNIATLKERGVEDILIACTDNLSGFSQAIEAVFPQTDIQNCIIHQLRNSSKYVSYKDLKALMADLKKMLKNLTIMLNLCYIQYTLKTIKVS